VDLGIGGRVALVTAASKGLGRAAALALAEEGAKVVICARGAEALAGAAADIVAMGGEVLSVVSDVTDPDAPERLVDAAVERFGGLHIVVPNAGGPPPGRALEVDDATLEAAFNANCLTTVRLVRAAAPHLRTAGWGRVCAITSYTIKQPSPGLVASNVARTALWAWAKTAAADLAGDNITVNLACPGLHLTDRLVALGGVPAGVRTGDPADFGRVVAFLCSNAAAFVSGVAVQVDGGATLGLL
jgi:3-oxoacyl-[acyl-carrier protein] reductase